MRNLLAAASRAVAICSRNAFAGVAGLALGSLFGFAMMIWGGRGSAVVLRNAYELDGVAVQDGRLDIYFDLDRLRDCPSDTSRWLWTWVDKDGKRIKQFFPLANSSTTLTDFGVDQRFILSMPLPAGIWPGEWYYWSKTVEHCPLLPSLFRVPVRESPDIPIHITQDPP